MSPRAAWRLDQLGFRSVADYAAGKMDWLAFALPYEGEARLAGSAVDRDVATCGMEERVAAVVARVGDAAAPRCVVLSDAGVVMGTVGEHALDAHPDTLVADAMRFGVTTVRPSEELDALRTRMRDRGVDSVLVTRSDGTLVGVLRGDRAAPERS
jgi:Mg/Co/Ni transporter MgtE